MADEGFQEKTEQATPRKKSCIAPEAVTAPIIYEDSYGLGQNFPHIYGVLNTDAVTQVIPLPAKNDGSFSLPDTLCCAAM